MCHSVRVVVVLGGGQQVGIWGYGLGKSAVVFIGLGVASASWREKNPLILRNVFLSSLILE